MTEVVNVEKAMLYEKYRLPYARDMVGDLLDLTGGAAVVADIGAGTGQLARLFAPRCAQVYAVEPDSAMRTVAAGVSKDYPNIHIINAFAEQTTLPDSSVDLIVIGNAFHRFKADAITELLRILKQSGWIAVISYLFTDNSFSDMLFSRLGSLESFAARSAQAWHQVPVSDLFGDSQTHAFTYTQSLTEDWEAFWGAARSGIEAPDPGDDDFAEFMKINRDVFDAFCIDGRICINYETRALCGQPMP